MQCIQRIDPKDQGAMEEIVRVLRVAYETEALELGLTEENCPFHPAFATRNSLEAAYRSSRVQSFCWCDDIEMPGFLMVRRLPQGIFELIRLCVIPGQRNRGVGARLFGFAEMLAEKSGCDRMAANIPQKNSLALKWCEKRGILPVSTLKISVLPYTLVYLEKKIG